MSKFKPGQKVVYVGRIELNKSMIYPKKGEIVEILSLANTPGFYRVCGYLLTKDHTIQIFTECSFEPIIEERTVVKHKLSSPCPKELLKIEEFSEVEKLTVEP